MKPILSILLAIYLCGFNGALSDQTLSSAPLTKQQQAWVSQAERHQKAGWVYLHIAGQPQERGFQYGYLMAKEIAESLCVRQVLWAYQTATDWTWLVTKSKAMTTAKIDAENLAEIDGIVEGLKAAGMSTSRDEMVAYNAFFELISYWWPTVKEKVGASAPNPPDQSCSAFIATGSMTADRNIVLGHNTWLKYPMADFNLILDIQPAKGHRIIMQTLPGWVHSGTDFFITDAGIVGTETTIGDFKGFDEKGIPEFARFRRATQDASSIDEWCAIMKRGNNGGYANSWLLGDVKTGEIARLELGLKYVGFEKKKDGYFTGSNIAEDLKILRFETSSNELEIKASSVARRVRWKQLMKEHMGTINVEKAKLFLADHYDTFLQKDNPDSRTLCGHSENEVQAGPGWPPAQYFPAGAFDAKVVDTTMARQMSFAARWGSACGTPFDAAKFLEQHPQFDWMAGILKSRPSQSWTEFKAGERKN
jgi:hypothetical protein